MLAPGQRVRKIETSIDLANAQNLLVAAGLGREIGDVDPVSVGKGVGYRRRSVPRQRLGIDERSSNAAETLLHAVAALILDAVVEEREIARAIARRDGGARIVQGRVEESADRGADLQRCEIGARALVLRVDPGIDVGAPRILQRPEWIGHPRTMPDIDGGVARRRRQPRRTGCLGKGALPERRIGDGEQAARGTSGEDGAPACTSFTCAGHAIRAFHRSVLHQRGRRRMKAWRRHSATSFPS